MLQRIARREHRNVPEQRETRAKASERGREKRERTREREGEGEIRREKREGK